MARVGVATFVPASGNNGSGTLPLDMIPADVIQEAEEVYQALKAANGSIRVEFETKAELATYLTQMKSYCVQRPAEGTVTVNGKEIPLDGPIRFRASPVKNQPETVVNFRIVDYTPAELAKLRGEELPDAVVETPEVPAEAPVASAPRRSRK